MSDTPVWVAAVAGSVAAIGTTGAVIFTAWKLHQERASRLRSQADRVGAWVDANKVGTNAVELTVNIRNTSDLPVLATPVLSALWPNHDVDTSANPFNYRPDQVLEGTLIAGPIQVLPGATVVRSATLNAEGDEYSLDDEQRVFLTGSPVFIVMLSLYVKDNAQRTWLYQLNPPGPCKEADTIKRTGPPLPAGLTLSSWRVRM
jgi:hypothetical protein